MIYSMVYRFLKMVILQFATSTSYGIPPSSNALTQVDVFVNVDGDIQKCEPSVGEPRAIGLRQSLGNRWGNSYVRCFFENRLVNKNKI